MPVIDETHVRSLIRQLDDANRLGYLRLGIEFLKAALAPPRSEVLPNRIDLDLSHLLEQPNACYTLERREDAKRPESGPDEAGFAFKLLGAAVALFFLASLAVGAKAILRWAWALFF